MIEEFENRTSLLEFQVAQLERENRELRDHIEFLENELYRAKISQKSSNKLEEANDTLVQGRNSNIASVTTVKKTKKASGTVKKLIDPAEEASKAYIALLATLVDSISLALSTRTSSMTIGELLYPGFFKVTHRITDILGLHPNGPMRLAHSLSPVLGLLHESLSFFLKYNRESIGVRDTTLELAAEQGRITY